MLLASLGAKRPHLVSLVLPQDHGGGRVRSLLCACCHSVCALCVVQVTNDDGSYINKVDVSLFPVSTEMSGALVRIAPGENL